MRASFEVGSIVQGGSGEVLQLPSSFAFAQDEKIVDLTQAAGVILSGLALVVLSPLMLCIAAAVALDSPGPVLFVSRRVGKNGKIFSCLKFRTMEKSAAQQVKDLLHRNERDKILFKITNDPRVTRIGKWLRKYSLDELPQLWNVLCGHMTLVGPRPALAHEVEQYQPGHWRRLSVTPGITGLWQVNARTDPSFERYVALDLEYVDRRSFWLDMRILFRTVGVVMRGTGS